MSIAIVGAGFGRTGTTSLKSAVESLGYGPCYHMLELIKNQNHVPVWEAAQHGHDVDWNSVFSEYGSTLDWPACRFWKSIWKAYPGSKVILTFRNPADWYESVKATLYPAMTDKSARQSSLLTLARQIVLEDTFQGRFLDRDHTLAVYRAHIEEVKSKVPAKELLVYNVSEGWEPICKFMDCSVPAIPFPHKNTRDEYRKKRQIPKQ